MNKKLLKKRDTSLSKPVFSDSLSLTSFAENYLRFKDKDGNEYKLNNTAMKMLKMIEKAQKKGCSLKQVWMRTKYKWMMVKD